MNIAYSQKSKHFFVLAFLLISINSYSQSLFSIGAKGSIGFNSENIDLWEYSLSGSNISTGYDISLNYQYYIDNKYFIKTGAEFSQVFANLKLADINIDATSYKIGIPLSVGIKFHDNYEVSIGASVQNYKDFELFDINSSYNLRTDVTLGFGYWITEKWRFDFLFSHMVTKQIDAYSASSYQNHILLGASYKLF